MNKKLALLAIIYLLAITGQALAQQPVFNKVIDEKANPSGLTSDLTHDQQGYIWFATENALKRYDGKEIISYRHDPENTNSIASNDIAAIACDSSGNIWIGFYGAGLDMFNPAANTFTHFKHQPSNTQGISADTIIAISTDRSGTVWLGSQKALDSYDKTTGKFTHFYPAGAAKQASMPLPVSVIYEDKAGLLWLGTGDPFIKDNNPDYGLYSLNRATGKFTHYNHDNQDSGGLVNGNVTSIFEDSKRNFWVGTQGNGLYIMNRVTGAFKHYPYTTQPGVISSPPLTNKKDADCITFITEDAKGKIWIASVYGGVNCYNPADKKTTHYGTAVNEKFEPQFVKDTAGGFTDYGAYRQTITGDGLLFIAGFSGNIYLVNYNRVALPFIAAGTAVNSFYAQPGTNTLWLGTNSGLVSTNTATGQRKQWKHEAGNSNSLSNNTVVCIRPGQDGHLWLATHGGGLEEFNINTGQFTHYRGNSGKPGSLNTDSLHYVFNDSNKYLWIGAEYGLSRMDIDTKTFTNYTNKEGDTASLGQGSAYAVVKDAGDNIWVASYAGAERFDKATGGFHHYLKNYIVASLFIDHTGVLWAGCQQGLFSYDPKKDNFKLFSLPGLPDGIESMLNAQEDNEGNFWIATINFIYKINDKRNQYKRYSAPFGSSSLDMWADNYKSPNGDLFFGNANGYFSFNPTELNDSWVAPLLNFTGLKIGEKDVYYGQGPLLTKPVWQTAGVQLSYNQNTFSIDFNAIDYHTIGAIKYMFLLDGFDNYWHNIGADHRAAFFNMPYGHYTLRVRATTAEGTMVEKSIIIDIARPWYKAWWAYCMYVLLLAFAGWGLFKYQQQRIIKTERKRTQEQELLHAKEIEKAYTELKATQAQLIQSEKMASLGELTAGIAHEIQNPLNFVNNFSEVSKELIEELQDERLKAEKDEALENEILNDIKLNLEKINHHGKRADAIVKGMLQHSSKSTGQKQPTDINALADEYLRLSYHGVRSKNSSFHVALTTNYGDMPGKINIIPQDIGRVLLNIFNNAFYAMAEKKKLKAEGYSPAIAVVTKSSDGKVQVKIKDNGVGIPGNIVTKIFQPFFTTKPTGEGTGLGLSLSYDIIVKAHQGSIDVNSVKNEFTEFTITLPVTG